MDKHDFTQGLHDVATHGVPDDSDLWRSIQQRVQPRRFPRIHPRPMLLMTSVTLLVIGLLSPSGRVWAQDVVDDLLLTFGFNRQLYIPQTREEITPKTEFQATAERTILCDASDVQFRTNNPAGFNNSLQQVQSQATFPIKLPTYLPKGVCGIDYFDFDPQQQLVVWLPTNLTFMQSPADLPAPTYGTNAIGDAPASQVAVNGDMGLWIESAPAGTSLTENEEGAQTSVVYENVLAWTENNVRYQLRAALTQEEMLKIAASLQ